MITKWISEFNAGDEILEYFLIKECSPRISSGNKLYLDLQLMDRTGEINAKYWEAQESELPLFVSGAIVKVKGSVQLFQNKQQLRVAKIRLAEAIDNVRTEDFVPCAPLEPQMMLDEILQAVATMEDVELQRLCSAFLTKYREPLMYYPAAKSNHHAIRSGLLYHVLRMLRSAEKLLQVYTTLNRDLLMTGVILHDIAKMEEMDAGELGIVKEYTIPGQLLGHLIQGITLVDRLGAELNISEETRMLVQHMILTHHYEPEFGSPKKPMIPEGELLHHLDMIDARMYDMENVLETLPAGRFSEPVWSLDRRRVYKPLGNGADGGA